jgi:hypothetical protein
MTDNTDKVRSTDLGEYLKRGGKGERFEVSGKNKIVVIKKLDFIFLFSLF